MDVIADLIEQMFAKLSNVIINALSLLSMTPESYNATLYNFSRNLSDVFLGIAIPMTVLFFFISLSDSGRTIADIRRPEVIIAEFVRLGVAYTIVVYSSTLLTKIMNVGIDIVNTAWNAAYSVGGIPTMTADNTLLETLEQTDFGWLDIGLDKLLLFILNLIMTIVLAIVAIYITVIVLTRMFKIYIYIALAPLPLSTLCCQSTSDVGKQFIKSFCGILLQGLIIVIALFLFTMFYSNVELTSTDAVGMTWEYFVEISIELLVLIAVIKKSDQIVYKMLGI